MFEKVKANALFQRKRTATEITIAVWNPQNGAIPQNTPSAIESAFLRLESELERTSSLKKAIKLFFLKLKIPKLETSISSNRIHREKIYFLMNNLL